MVRPAFLSFHPWRLLAWILTSPLNLWLPFLSIVNPNPNPSLSPRIPTVASVPPNVPQLSLCPYGGRLRSLSSKSSGCDDDFKTERLPTLVPTLPLIVWKTSKSTGCDDDFKTERLCSPECPTVVPMVPCPECCAQWYVQLFFLSIVGACLLALILTPPLKSLASFSFHPWRLLASILALPFTSSASFQVFGYLQVFGFLFFPSLASSHLQSSASFKSSASFLSIVGVLAA